MALLPQTLTFRRAAWSPEAITQLQAAEDHDTTAGLESIEAYARMRIPLFECVDDAGEVLGRYVLELQTGMHGVKNLQIVAAAGGAPGIDMAGAMIEAIEKQAQLVGADWVSFQTARLGLVRKMIRHAYGIHGVVMRKRVGAAQ